MGALAENVLMMQHAVEFRFDRLKLIIPLAIAIAFAAARLRPHAAMLGSVLLGVAMLQNAGIYRQTMRSYAPWSTIDHANHALADRVAASADLTCATLATAGKVRAYSNMLFARGIHERVTPEMFVAMSRSPVARRCGAVYLTDVGTYVDLPEYNAAEVRRGDHIYRVRAAMPAPR